MCRDLFHPFVVLTITAMRIALVGRSAGASLGTSDNAESRFERARARSFLPHVQSARMNMETGGPTLRRADEAHGAWASTPASQGLPRDLIRQATPRLRVMALLYAAVFFLADIFPSLISEHDRAMLFGAVVAWLPATISITVALFVAAVAGNPRLSPRTIAALAIAFEIASSYGIAAAELLQPRGLDFRNASWIGLSWVAVWTLLFTIVVPSSPRRSVLAALAASSGVPVMAAVSFAVYPPPMLLNSAQFFFLFVFPYLLVVAMAYVGARVLFALGNEVRKARELGSYRLLERLGQGGMGEVWSARHRLLARPAAIKLIRPLTGPSNLGSDAARRFEREAQALASLRSPNTVDLFDFGIADDGTFYYVMELLEGLDAERFVNTFGPMPAARVIFVLRQVCHSLSEAESISLVHRDIKPANIMLCRYGEDYDFVKVLDFGIVKAIRKPGNGDDLPTLAALTAEHVVQGTPAFIAPEQVLGGLPVDHRADIYGIGCLAYWLLTGRLVFTGETPMQLLIQHAQAAPEPPSSRTELPIPAELDAIVLACLAKDPSERPQTARELARRLDAVPVADEWTPELAGAWWAAHQPVPS
jgi:eukaryotic-like serine/threonine-protein kinase